MSSAVAERTATPERPADAGELPEPPPSAKRPARRDRQAPPPNPPLGRGARITLQIVAAFVLLLLFCFMSGLYMYGLSGLSEQRAQDTMRKSFSHELSTAVAPVKITTEGRPMAVLDIPKIGLHSAVVVEGTSARDLTNGPGHSMSSVLPGQAGTSVIFARRNTFGAPFAHLMRLDRGDRIKVTTGQGVATYVVSSFGDKAHPAPANSTNRLVLVTADAGLVPGNFVTVSADLHGSPFAGTGQVAAPSADQLPLARGFDDSLLPALLWSQALVVVVIAGVVAFVRWKPVAAYLCVTPLLIVVLWNLFENLSCLTPNLY